MFSSCDATDRNSSRRRIAFCDAANMTAWSTAVAAWCAICEASSCAASSNAGWSFERAIMIAPRQRAWLTSGITSAQPVPRSRTSPACSASARRSYRSASLAAEKTSERFVRIASSEGCVGDQSDGSSSKSRRIKGSRRGSACTAADRRTLPFSTRSIAHQLATSERTIARDSRSSTCSSSIGSATSALVSAMNAQRCSADSAASRAARSRPSSLAFLSYIAACDAINSSAMRRSGVNTPATERFSRYTSARLSSVPARDGQAQHRRRASMPAK